MSIAESFNTYLEGNATITAVLASAEAIWMEGLPQAHDGFPALVHSLSGEEGINMLSGGENETAFATIRIDIWATASKTCHDIATVLKSELLGFRGAMGTNTVVDVKRQVEFATPQEADTGLNRVVLDFRIAYY